ncbi:hypothetical protein F4861DRAFT_321466 [Xylaria intraflava]|nr:hypothetical protein F4861DRAFT_321466 [Xylaria intraflava]
MTQDGDMGSKTFQKFLPFPHTWVIFPLVLFLFSPTPNVGWIIFTTLDSKTLSLSFLTLRVVTAYQGVILALFSQRVGTGHGTGQDQARRGMDGMAWHGTACNEWESAY